MQNSFCVHYNYTLFIIALFNRIFNRNICAITQNSDSVVRKKLLKIFILGGIILE